MTEYGTKVKPEKAARLEATVSASLAPNEAIWFILRTNGAKPFVDYFVVTDSRVMTVMSTDPNPIKRQVFSDEFIGATVTRTATAWRMLTLMAPDGSTIKLGEVVEKDDVPRLLQVLEHLRLHGGGSHAREQDVEAQSTRQAEVDNFLADTTVISAQLNGGITKKALEQIRAHARSGERPWFVLTGGGSTGVLAAFDDRLMIIKTGGMTGWMAGAMGGGRMTTFMYSEITGLEYNAGMMNGVLEVLTASYQGTANQDFWRGTNRGRNANSGDPFTLSNTLPLDKATHTRALPQLNELRQRIAQAKTPTVVVQAPTASAQPVNPSVTEELMRLGELRAAGVLTDEEFNEAKASLLAKLRDGG